MHIKPKHNMKKILPSVHLAIHFCVLDKRRRNQNVEKPTAAMTKFFKRDFDLFILKLNLCNQQGFIRYGNIG